MRVISISPMMDYRRGWFSLAISDEAFFNVALSLVAADGALTLRQGDPTEAILYRMEATRILSERMGLPRDRIADGTLGAVAVLANYEVSLSQAFDFTSALQSSY
jgi:hypothetical protein